MPRVNLKKRLQERFRIIPAKLRAVPILIGVSAGMDSSVLASVALELRETLPPLHFVHLNYHLRIPDSDREEAWLRAWAKREKIPIFVKSLRPPRLGGNLQAWAREQRLQFCARILARRFNNQGQIWLAHHQRDQAETILSRILRGSGLKGIGGMEILEIYRGMILFRPWLDVPYEALQIYAQNHTLKFHRDRSNDSDRYLRNRVRRQILPMLAKENPRIQETLCALGARSSEAYAALEKLGRDWLARRRQRPAELKLGALRRQPHALAAVILEIWLRKHTRSEQSWGEILPVLLGAGTANSVSWEIPLKNGYRVLIQTKRLLLRRARAKTVQSPQKT